MRDYLYLPLGGSRVRPNRLCLNLGTVFVLSGLWHGAAWNFLARGAYHGLFMVLERLFLLRVYGRLGVASLVPTYNHEVAWPDNRPEGTEVWRLDRKQQYLSRDIIVVMFTEYNLGNPDSSFSDNAYNLFTPFTAAVRKLENQLSQRPGLKEYWWKKGTETGKTEAQLIHEQAVAAYDSLRD